MFDHEVYLSPFTWRYGGDEMRRLWSEAHKRRLWRRVWVALAEVQCEAGLVTPEQVADLQAHEADVDIARAHHIEAEIRHDLMAEVRAYAEQCPVGGGIIHLGATSTDVEDNADALRLRDGLALIRERLVAVLAAFAAQIERWADTPCMAYTHIQPAEPTTVGYRLCQYAQDLLEDLRELDRIEIRGKGIRGAVGTSASYAQLLGADGGGESGVLSPADLERRVMERLGLKSFRVVTQVYPRKQDYRVLTALAAIAQSLHKFAFDLRVLQAPPFGEWSEPFGRNQVGSSAMPFKRNPVAAENICSLARYVSTLPGVAWDNAAHSLLERTLDDSASRRVVLAESFLAVDEILGRARRIVEGLVVNEGAVARNLTVYGTFAASERLLMELVKAGADRQEMHEVIREHAMAAWAAVQAGGLNGSTELAEVPLVEQLSGDPAVLRYLDAERVRALLDASNYVGDAPERSRTFLEALREAIG